MIIATILDIIYGMFVDAIMAQVVIIALAKQHIHIGFWCPWLLLGVFSSVLVISIRNARS